MNLFLKRSILYFAGPAFLFLFSCEFILRSIPNNYAYKYSWLERYAPSVNVLILGSSHTLNGINPSDFPMTAFNAAYSNQTLKYDDFIFSKYLNRMDSLKWVVIPVDYHTLVSDLDDEAEGDDWRVKYYHIYYHGFINNELKYYFEVSDLDFTLLKEIYKKVTNWGYTHRDCDSLGFFQNDGISDNQRLWMPQVRGEVCDQRIHSNKFHLEHIIAQCSNNGTNVILLNCACSRRYIEVFDTEYWGNVITYCDSLVSCNSNVHHINLLNDTTFTDIDFFNPDHLNITGAQKMTEVIVSYIESSNVGGVCIID